MANKEAIYNIQVKKELHDQREASRILTYQKKNECAHRIAKAHSTAPSANIRADTAQPAPPNITLQPTNKHLCEDQHRYRQRNKLCHRNKCERHTATRRIRGSISVPHPATPS
nr:uncharacterized protein LOC116650068 [Drosophila virilis]